MLAAVLIAFREGLEAALVVGVLLGYLHKSNHGEKARLVWLGVLGAALSSVVLAGVIQAVGFELEGRPEMLFEALTMLLAAGILTWMIFWMRYQARANRVTLEREMAARLSAGQNSGLVALAFIAVFREGVETVLFLSAAAFVDQAVGTLVGALLGLILAGVAGYLVYTSAVRLNVRLFFSVTSLLLLLFAAGLLSSSVHELQEAQLLPVLTSHLWNTGTLLSDRSTLGELLRAVAGYNSSPSLAEVIAYWGYWIVTLVGVRWLVERKVARLPAEGQPV